MDIKYGILAISLALAGCGGGSQVQVSQARQLPSASTPIQHRSNVVAFMGDSITHNWEAYFPIAPFAVVNLGVSGNLTYQMEDRFQAQVIEASPEVGVIVIDGGINDIPHDGVTVPSIEHVKNMAAMANAAGIRVIIASLMLEDYQASPTDIHPNEAQVDAFNAQLLKLCADNGYLYADYRDVMLNADGTEDDALYIDGLHPNEAGYARMWPVILPLIQEELR